MKKLAILAATVLMSATAFAGNQTSYNNASKVTEDFETKAEAYEAGFNYVDTLAGASYSELRFQLSPPPNKTISSISVDDTQVTVEEFAKSRGEIAYRAVVNIDYHFIAHNNSND